MGALKVYLFGRFGLAMRGREEPGLSSTKAQELFSYLLLRRGPHSRDSLAGLLWPEHEQAQARKHLRQALWQLQTALGGELGRVLQVNVDWVAITSEADLWLDILAFERCCDYARGIRGQDLSAEQAGKLGEAVGLYRGDFREGCYEDWNVYERERLQALYLGILDKLASYSEVHAQYEPGIEYCMRILGNDPACERAHRQLMRLEYLAGDRTAALRQYQRCVSALRRELDVGPSRSTLALYARIRADALDEPGDAGAATGQDADNPLPSLADALSNLRQIGTYLDDARRQVHDQIRVAERLLSRRP